MLREQPRFATSAPAVARLVRRLRLRLDGQVHADAATRARYACDASPWRIPPAVVVTPKHETDVVAALELAAELGVSVVPRGSGCATGGESLPQRAGESIVIDASRHLDAIVDFDAGARRVVVQPGLTLAALNAFLAPHGLWLPLEGLGDAQASIGGLVACDAIGARTVGAGSVGRHLDWIDALLADGTRQRLGRFGVDGGVPLSGGRAATVVSAVFDRVSRDGAGLLARRPLASTAVGGYRLDTLLAGGQRDAPEGRSGVGAPLAAADEDVVNLARLLAGSRGSLCWFERLCFALTPIPPHRRLLRLGFDDARAAMRAMPAILASAPAAATLLGDASLMLELHATQSRDLAQALEGLRDIVAGATSAPDPALRVRCEADEPAAIDAIWRGLRPPLPGAAGALDGAALETWRVPLDALDDYAAQVEAACERVGVAPSWLGAVASGAPTLTASQRDGTAHVDDAGAIGASLAMAVAAIAERVGGVPVSEHGDDAVRRDAVERVHGARVRSTFEAVKDIFDPAGLFNPGKVVRGADREPSARRGGAAPRGTSPRPACANPPAPASIPSPSPSPSPSHSPRPTALHALPPRAGGGQAAVLMQLADACDGNGACRRVDPGAMCPSLRVTRAERDGPRGRAATLRAALDGRLGAAGVADPSVRAALDLCVGCKACRSACPNGVDVSRMKILATALAGRDLGVRDRLIASLPLQLHRWRRWRPLIAALLATRRLPPVAIVVERVFGLRRDRRVPHWRADSFHEQERRSGATAAADVDAGAGDGRTVVLWVDTFTDRAEPAIAHAARRVLRAGGYRVEIARPMADDASPARPLCCGRTFLQAGQLEHARAEARRTLRALARWIDAGVPIVGCEPACVLGFRDEYRWLDLGPPFDSLVERLARGSFLFEEFLAREHRAARYRPRFVAPAGRDARTGRAAASARVLLHPHCHERAFDLVDAARLVLGWVPGLAVETVSPGCCGMAGGFGYDARHRAAASAMAGLATTPALAACDADTIVLADGASCRQQIRDGADRRPMHTAELLAMALPPT